MDGKLFKAEGASVLFSVGTTNHQHQHLKKQLFPDPLKSNPKSVACLVTRFTSRVAQQIFSFLPPPEKATPLFFSLPLPFFG